MARQACAERAHLPVENGNLKARYAFVTIQKCNLNVLYGHSINNEKENLAYLFRACKALNFLYVNRYIVDNIVDNIEITRGIVYLRRTFCVTQDSKILSDIKSDILRIHDTKIVRRPSII